MLELGAAIRIGICSGLLSDKDKDFPGSSHSFQKPKTVVSRVLFIHGHCPNQYEFDDVFDHHDDQDSSEAL